MKKYGYYGKNTSWWVYSGDKDININEYKNNILCFPSEAKKEIYLAEQRKFYSIFNDGIEKYVNIISECEANNIPFVILLKGEIQIILHLRNYKFNVCIL